MDLDFQQHIPIDFDDNSKVWIYQSNRLFTIPEAFELDDMLQDFVSNWKSHAAEVMGYANLFFGQFIILMADETASGVSGCSTDSSVRLIRSIEKKYSVQLFERENLAFIINDKVELLPLHQLNNALENNFINTNTLYFNNTVLSKKELLNNWIIPLSKSWLAKKVKMA